MVNIDYSQKLFGTENSYLYLGADYIENFDEAIYSTFKDLVTEDTQLISLGTNAKVDETSALVFGKRQLELTLSANEIKPLLSIGNNIVMGSKNCIVEYTEIGNNNTWGRENSVLQGTTFGDNIIVGNFNHFSESSNIGSNSNIGNFNDFLCLEGVKIGSNSVVGDNNTFYGDMHNSGNGCLIGNKNRFINATIGDGVKIGNCCQFGNGVSIGSDTIIGNNVIVGDGITIPANYKIGDNVIIAEQKYLSEASVIKDDDILGSTLTLSLYY